MNCNRRILTAIGATGLVLASVAMTIPAQAAPTAGITATSDRIDASLSGNTATFGIAGTNGSSIRIEAGGKTLAGSVIAAGSASIQFTTTSQRTDYTVVETIGGKDSTVGTVTLGTDSAALPRPGIDGVDNTTKNSLVTVTGEPGALVRIQDGDTTVGLKMLGSKGTAEVPVKVTDPDSDTKLSVEQSKGATTSETSLVDWYAPPKVDVVTEYEGGAIIKLSAAYGASVFVYDAEGKKILRRTMTGRGEAFATVGLHKGETSKFTAVRQDNATTSRPLEFSAVGSNVKLAAPKVTFHESNLGGMGTFMRVQGVPYTEIQYLDEHGNRTGQYGSLNADGLYIDRNLRPGATYRLVNAIYDYQSAVTTATAPAS